jgi:antitoxin component of RelBE/YafQ-DinJ toxin-antitoxin module
MKTAVINFKTEAELKKKAQKKAESLGMSLSNVLNAYLRKFLRVKDVDFVEEELVPTPYLEKILRESEKEMKEGYVSPSFSDPEEMIKWLNDPKARYANGNPVRRK